MFKNKVLLITGGTGSFGNAMVDKILNSEKDPSRNKGINYYASCKKLNSK